MKNIHQRSIRACSNLIGIPYKQKDCWAIVVDFYLQVFDIQLNNYYTDIPTSVEGAGELVQAHLKDFEEVKVPSQLGDIMLIKMYGVACHIAVDLGDGRMLHTTDHSGCVIERTLRWERLIVGRYRVRKAE